MEGKERISQDRTLRGFSNFQTLSDRLYDAIKEIFRFHPCYVVTRTPVPVFNSIAHVSGRGMFFQFVVVSRRIIRSATLIVQGTDVLDFTSQRRKDIIQNGTLSGDRHVQAFCPGLTRIKSVRRARAVRGNRIFISGANMFSQRIRAYGFVRFNARYGIRVNGQDYFRSL